MFSQNYERMNLADAVVPKTYSQGERIIKQGQYKLNNFHYLNTSSTKVNDSQPNQLQSANDCGKHQYLTLDLFPQLSFSLILT